jgi:predicted nucleic acid-binding protein
VEKQVNPIPQNTILRISAEVSPGKETQLQPRGVCAMSGKRRFVLDTNALVSLLAGNHVLSAQLQAAEYVGISIISYLEFLTFDGLSDSDHSCFADFCNRVDVVSLSNNDSNLMKQTLELRSNYRLKLPDAIIGATALSRNALLITNDSHFSGIELLTVQGC